jgi:hypothetical protein
MNLTIELSDEKAAALIAQAAARGLTVEQWLEQIAEQLAEAQPDSIARLQETNPKGTNPNERARAFEQWARNHPNRPPLPESAFRRENMLRDVGSAIRVRPAGDSQADLR